MKIVTGLCYLAFVVLTIGCGTDLGKVQIFPTLEHKNNNGDLYTPATQSLLRTHSWLEQVNEIDISVGPSYRGRFLFKDDFSKYFLELHNIPLNFLVPRLNYQPSNPPDDFDAFNLMLAEFSRNSISVPLGSPEDKMAKYQTDLPETVPWKLMDNYDFVPNKYYRPLRVGVVNNCLKPGLWEINAIDRSGEIYHSWFNLTEKYYYTLVTEVNQLTVPFVSEALQWSEDEVKLDLSRLREKIENFGTVNIAPTEEILGFSSQDSRRRIENNYALYEYQGMLRSPTHLSEFTKHPMMMTSFIEPGIYSSKMDERTEFNFSFLANPLMAEINLVKPRTSYKLLNYKKANQLEEDYYLEIDIDLGQNKKLIIGNLPLHLLVQQEDFVLHGFGVGILNSAGFAERRKFLFEKGPSPSYAYLATQKGDNLYGLNSHKLGVEQIFIRSVPFAEDPYWEVTVASYERIVDIIKYKVEIPERLITMQKEHSRRYIPPIYFTYRDDNIN